VCVNMYVSGGGGWLPLSFIGRFQL